MIILDFQSPFLATNGVAFDYAPKSVLIRATLSEGAGPGVVEGRVLGVDLTVKAQGRGRLKSVLSGLPWEAGRPKRRQRDVRARGEAISAGQTLKNMTARTAVRPDGHVALWPI